MIFKILFIVCCILLFCGLLVYVTELVILHALLRNTEIKKYNKSIALEIGLTFLFAYIMIYIFLL